ncbi:Y+L amino acid transporter 2 isoform X2 [Lingula anatina]|uniref:Y+L amino acid transporter 2 isoform X2 n=1 Tax=Lingula anatina TaxID=7574 RepID=A0A1S3JGT5_LINAN|nr:Y+L amino acid transporter 2 isoform X2 [Lingula anatina]|eukprot:XP_013409620.1 Y+L amino acid transporter 2 isoform X2 [Lingula anatina]
MTMAENEGTPAEKEPMNSNTNTDSSGRTDAVTLKKEMGLLQGVAIIVGTIVGSGIFVSPKGVLQYSGSVGASLMLWAACGVVSLVGAMCYTELGTFILISGADYAYIRHSFGNFVGFLFLWVLLVIITPTSNAIIALTFANYMIQPFFPHCPNPEIPTRLLAAACLCLLTFVNCASVKWANKVQVFFTAAKLLALAIIIITGIVRFAMGHTESFENAFEGSSDLAGDYGLAFFSGFFSYTGWNYLNFVTEEIKNPNKNLPRSIWISIPVVTGFYILVNIAYFTVLSPAEMLASDAVAVTFAEKMFGIMAWIMPVFVACSCFGGLNGCIIASSRLFFIGGRNGHLPDFLSLINTKHFTPVPALLFSCILSLLMLVTTDVYTLISYMTFIEVLIVFMSVTGLLYLRYREPNAVRPIKVSLWIPISFVLMCFVLLVLPLIFEAKECLIGILIMSTGIPVYWLGVLWKRKPKSFLNLTASFTILVQKMFMAVQEDETPAEVKFE